VVVPPELPVCPVVQCLNINLKNSVIASVAWQSHNLELVAWRLLRHFVPRNDECIKDLIGHGTVEAL
jgi:hypothetical protein